MDKKSRGPSSLKPPEIRDITDPASLASFIFFIIIIFIGVKETVEQRTPLIFFYGLAGIIINPLFYYLVIPQATRTYWVSWLGVALNLMVITLGYILLPPQWVLIPHLLLGLTACITIVLWGRPLTYTLIALSVGLRETYLFFVNDGMTSLIWPNLILLVAILALTETTQRLNRISARRIERLESLSEFSRRVSSSIESDEVICLLSQAIKDALASDTYFVGQVEGDHIKIEIFYDEGEYYDPFEVPIAGTLSGWVVNNKKPLLIPDLREEIALDGVDVILAGKDKNNLCWMGAPMELGEVYGMIVVASYRPYAFDRTDFELLENLGQQAALALRNARHHGEVERQSQQDSLTSVYNHGYFIKLLEKASARALEENDTLSLIMLDIDYFKQYNDTYGHLLGDKVLIALTDAIRTHVHLTDIVGRWGGEEFCIFLPSTSGAQATLVAERIQQTMMSVKLTHENKGEVPAPTVSQGIAVFPDEADEIYGLIDLADQRLYVAKERGRNQVEPKPSHWGKIKG